MAQLPKSLLIKEIANTKWSTLPDSVISSIYYELKEVQERLSVDPTTTTKVCPNCKNDKLLLLHTSNKKICTDCNTVIEWNLEKGQKRII